MNNTKRERAYADILHKTDMYAAACIRELADEVDRLRKEYNKAAMALKNIHEAMWLDAEKDVETKWKPLLAAAKDVLESQGVWPSTKGLREAVAACEEKP